MNPGNCLFSDSGKLGIRQDHPHRQIEMKFRMVGSEGSSKVGISSKSKTEQLPDDLHNLCAWAQDWLMLFNVENIR